MDNTPAKFANAYRFLAHKIGNDMLVADGLVSAVRFSKKPPIQYVKLKSNLDRTKLHVSLLVNLQYLEKASGEVLLPTTADLLGCIGQASGSLFVDSSSIIVQRSRPIVPVLCSPSLLSAIVMSILITLLLDVNPKQNHPKISFRRRHSYVSVAFKTTVPSPNLSNQTITEIVPLLGEVLASCDGRIQFVQKKTQQTVYVRLRISNQTSLI